MGFKEIITKLAYYSSLFWKKFICLPNQLTRFTPWKKSTASMCFQSFLHFPFVVPVRLLGGNTTLAFFGKNGDRVRNNDLLDPVMLKISAR